VRVVAYVRWGDLVILCACGGSGGRAKRSHKCEQSAWHAET